jgi:hypothetical protein
VRRVDSLQLVLLERQVRRALLELKVHRVRLGPQVQQGPLAPQVELDLLALLELKGQLDLSGSRSSSSALWATRSLFLRV